MIKTKEYSLVHFHISLDKKSVLRELLYIYAAKKRKQPYIMHLHGGGYIFNKKYYRLCRWILNGADKIVVLNQAERDSIAELYKVDISKIQVLRNCIDLNEIKNLDQRPGFRNRIIYFGRIDRNKGLKEIVEALSQLKIRQVPFHFEVYGAGPDEEWFFADLRQAIGESFEFKGRVWGKSKMGSIKPKRYLPASILQ
ncbi:glycosyltransferase [Paraflavitalea speifideaquila]|uniref:glycosyltransferase n=1 Tax=Paraflavitalea speifideaquila TaxID=3076558 RepID=UPI0028ED44A4|nr:glycosyltransferase [Paraflavitalea speifideiaquila]